MKTKANRHNYGKCHVCCTLMTEKRINQDFWIKDRLVVLQDVPTGVCPRCGEKVVRADVGRRIADLLGDSRRLRRSRTMNVPVIRFAKEVA